MSIIGQRFKEAGSNILTREEREILILTAPHLYDRQLSNAKVSQRLGISLSRVKTLIHQACIKMRAHNKYEALLFAMRRGEINLNDVYSLDELAEVWISLSPYMLRMMTRALYEDIEHRLFPGEHWHLSGMEERITPVDRRQDAILTKSEREVLILAGRGLTNREIANMLCITTGSVKTFLYRACTKLGARKRMDAVQLALKQKEISIGDMYTLNEFIEVVAPLGPERLGEIVQMLKEKLRQKPVQTHS